MVEVLKKVSRIEESRATSENEFSELFEELQSLAKDMLDLDGEIVERFNVSSKWIGGC